MIKLQLNPVNYRSNPSA